MYGPLTLLLLAVAAASAGIVRRGPGRRLVVGRPPGSLEPEVLRSFVLVGAVALAVLTVAVLVVGLLDRADRAEGLAVIGLYGYLAYLAVAVLVSGWLARRR